MFNHYRLLCFLFCLFIHNSSKEHQWKEHEYNHVYFGPCLSIGINFAKNVSWFSFSLVFLKETSQSCNQAWGPSTQGKIFLRNLGFKTMMNIFLHRLWLTPSWQNKFIIISAKGTAIQKESGDCHWPIRLTQCCTQFKPLGNKTFCFRNFHII